MARSLILLVVSEYTRYEVNCLLHPVAAAAMDIAEPILEPMGYELVDVAFEKRGTEWFLTFYIDKESGITVDDCEIVSMALDEKMDAHPDIHGKHDHLIVSSPGLDRPIKSDRDFMRQTGKELDIKLYESMDGKKAITDILISFDPNSIEIKTRKKTLTVMRSNIALARLHLNMNLEGRK